MTTIAVWGLRRGETDRANEELLAGSCRDQRDVERVTEAAKKDGFHSFRQATFEECERAFARTFRNN